MYTYSTVYTFIQYINIRLFYGGTAARRRLPFAPLLPWRLTKQKLKCAHKRLDKHSNTQKTQKTQLPIAASHWILRYFVVFSVVVLFAAYRKNHHLFKFPPILRLHHRL